LRQRSLFESAAGIDITEEGRDNRFLCRHFASCRNGEELS
jgi:hypothetical protein